MKKIQFIFLFVVVCTVASFAQKNKLQSAFNYYKEPYKQYDKAIEAIEEAAVHEQTSTWAKTWYYKGLIYMSLYESETYGSLCNNCLLTSFDAFKKALELDPANEWADEIKAIRIPYLSYHTFSKGINYFKEQNFNEALSAFEMVQRMSPSDTSAVLNAAYSAEQAGNNEKAISYYQKLIDMKFNDDDVYTSYSNLLKRTNQMEKALNVVREGRKLFPDTLSLMLSEINILLSTERSAEASVALDAAIVKDPGNPNLYLALGSSYDNLANPRDAGGKELVKPDNSKELMIKAEQAYKKGLEISPDNYELNYNLGAMYFNEGAEMANATNNIKDNVLFEKEKKRYEDKFREAQPHLEKAMEFNPKANKEDMNLYEGTIISLKELYVRINEMEKYEKIKNLIAK